MTPHERQAQIRAQILGSYNNAAPIKKSEEEKPLDEEKEKKEDPEKKEDKEEGEEIEKD